MEQKLIKGGIYNLKQYPNDNNPPYCIVVDEMDGEIVLNHPYMYIDTTHINNKNDLTALILLGIQMVKLRDISFSKVKKISKEMIDGYLGTVDDDCLMQLQALARLKYYKH